MKRNNLQQVSKVVVLLPFLFMFSCAPPADSIQLQFTALSYNMWLGGEAQGNPIEYSADVIMNSGAGVAGLQEVIAYPIDGAHKKDNGLLLAKIFGWHHFAQGTSAIISKYPIVDSTANRLGVKLALDSEKFVWFFNGHFNHMPYQPYQLASIPYGDFPFINTEEEAIIHALSARGDEMNLMIREIKSIMTDGWPVILTGDFNEPSWLDWTERSVEAGLCRIKVEWPATKAIHTLGLKDAYREVYPDETKHRGETWSSIDTPGELHDRIDFVFFSETLLKIVDATTLGGEDEISGVSLKNYPSDHRAISATFEWKK